MAQKIFFMFFTVFLFQLVPFIGLFPSVAHEVNLEKLEIRLWTEDEKDDEQLSFTAQSGDAFVCNRRKCICAGRDDCDDLRTTGLCETNSAGQPILNCKKNGLCKCRRPSRPQSVTDINDMTPDWLWP